MRNLKERSNGKELRIKPAESTPVTGVVVSGFNLQEFDRMLEGARQRMRDEEREGLLDRTQPMFGLGRGLR